VSCVGDLYPISLGNSMQALLAPPSRNVRSPVLISFDCSDSVLACVGGISPVFLEHGENVLLEVLGRGDSISSYCQWSPWLLQQYICGKNYLHAEKR